MDDIQIPVAYCTECSREGPVVIEEIKGKEWNILDIKTSLTIIYCPECQTLLNLLGDIEVKYFSPEELAKTGWVVANARKSTTSEE